jgi:probable HAF family extracellular repeat protein
VALNNGGRVIGTYQWRDGSTHSFTYRNGIKNDLGTLTGYDNKVTAINNSGQIVGVFTKGDLYYPETFVQLAYLRNPNGEVILLGSLDNSMRTVPLGINDSGVIVGSSGDYAFVYRNGRMFKLGEFHGQRIFSATAINNRGQILALYQGATYVRTFLYSGCQMQDLPIGKEEVVGTAINDHGAVVGSVPSDWWPYSQTFLYAGGQTQLLGDFAPTHLNNSGQISGDWMNYDQGQQYPVILGPATLNLVGLFGSYGIYQGSGVAAGINDSGQIIGYGPGYGTGRELDIAVLMTPIK